MRDSEPLSAPPSLEWEVDCRACGRRIALVPDSLPLWMHCVENHFLTIGELLDQELPRSAAPRDAVVELWKTHAALLKRKSDIAFAMRRPVMAAGFCDAALRIEERLQVLRASPGQERDALRPSREVPLPESATGLASESPATGT